MKESKLLPIVPNYSINDRDFDYNHQELSSIKLIAKVIETVNNLIEHFNSFQGNIDRKEDSINITNNRKLSPTGDFSGSLLGKQVFNVLANIDSNEDKIKYIANQFSDGYTGLVIEGGFFEDSPIQRNYDGGIF